MGKTIAVLLLLSVLLRSESLDILDKDRQKLRFLEKEQIESGYDSLKNDWISPLNIGSGISKSISSSGSETTTKKVYIGFSQNIFESGGIKFSIQYAEDKFRYDTLFWEKENLDLLQKLYETVLEIRKLKLQLQQSFLKLKNSEIEVEIKKIKYKTGLLDITEFNNAVITKNSRYQESEAIKNSLKNQEYELSKLTSFSENEIEISDYNNLSKDEFINSNIALKLQEAKADMEATRYNKTVSGYLPKLSLNGEYGYLNSETALTTASGDYNSIGLTLSIPLDFNTNSTLQESKLEYLKQKLQTKDLKRELEHSYGQVISQIETYKNYNKTIKENISLYDELVKVTSISSQSGRTAGYDLDILSNTKEAYRYELLINDINIKQQFAKLYFQIQR